MSSPYALAEAAISAALPGLRARYAEPWRHYHGQGHIDALLALLARHRDAFADPNAALLAVWYHDAIYCPWSSGNEAASAVLLHAEMDGLVPPATLARAEAMVLATANHRPPPGADEADCALFLDMDLSILGASPEDYDRYEAAIAREFLPYYSDSYLDGRRAALGRLAARCPLFITPVFAPLEGAAAANLVRAVAALGAL